MSAVLLLVIFGGHSLTWVVWALPCSLGVKRPGQTRRFWGDSLRNLCCRWFVFLILNFWDVQPPVSSVLKIWRNFIF